MRRWKIALFYLFSSVFLLAFFFLAVNDQWQERQEAWFKERARQELRLLVQALQAYHHTLGKNLSRLGIKRHRGGAGVLSRSDWESLPDVAFMAAWEFSGRGAGDEGSGLFSLHWKETSPLLNKDISHFALSFKRSNWTEIRLEQLLKEKVPLYASGSREAKASLNSSSPSWDSMKYTFVEDSQGNKQTVLLFSLRFSPSSASSASSSSVSSRPSKSLNLLILLGPHFFQSLIHSQKGLRASLGLLTPQERFSLAHTAYPIGVLPLKHRAVVEKIHKTTFPRFSHGFFTNEGGEDFFAAYEPVPSTNLYAFWAYELSSLPFYHQSLRWSFYLSFALLALLSIPFFFFLYARTPSGKNFGKGLGKGLGKGFGKGFGKSFGGGPGRASESGLFSSSAKTQSPDFASSGPSHPSHWSLAENREISQKRQREILTQFYRRLEKPFKEGLFHIKAHAKALQFKKETNPFQQGSEILKEARKMSRDLESFGDALGERNSSEKAWFKINLCIEKALEEVFHELERENISLQFNLRASRLWKVEGNGARLCRAFKALLLNFLHAMRASTTRELHFTSFQEGERACIRMEDQRNGFSLGSFGEDFMENQNLVEDFGGPAVGVRGGGIGLSFAQEVFRGYGMSLHLYPSKKSGYALDICFKMSIIKKEESSTAPVAPSFKKGKGQENGWKKQENGQEQQERHLDLDLNNKCSKSLKEQKSLASQVRHQEKRKNESNENDEGNENNQNWQSQPLSPLM